MKKELITVQIALHPVQARIIKGCQNGTLILPLPLREIARNIKWKESPQMIKFHLGMLVKLGALQVIHGEYKYIRSNKKAN